MMDKEQAMICEGELKKLAQEEGAGISRAFHLTYEQDVTVQKALFVIRSSSKESDTDALVRLCQFFLKNGLGTALVKAAY